MAKQKTPMMQLLEKLNHAKKQLSEQNERSHDYNKGYDNGYYDCLTNIINDIELQMIPIECVVIIDSFWHGYNNGKIDTRFSGKDYYEKYFEIKKDTTAHLCNKHGELDEAGAYADDEID